MVVVKSVGQLIAVVQNVETFGFVQVHCFKKNALNGQNRKVVLLLAENEEKLVPGQVIVVPASDSGVVELVVVLCQRQLTRMLDHFQQNAP